MTTIRQDSLWLVAYALIAVMGTAPVQALAATEAVLHRFSKLLPKGVNPYAGVVRDAAGNLYGTTGLGGAGVGLVYKLDASGKETVLHSFQDGSDGASPTAGVVLDSAGNLYGTTPAGGTANAGVVYKVDTSGQETVLYSFTGGADGGVPSSGVFRDSSGNLYGTTVEGGTASGAAGGGVVYELDTSGQETVLYSFTATGNSL
jgi:uncharacterized repeat protein (TIGR03803 family)